MNDSSHSVEVKTVLLVALALFLLCISLPLSKILFERILWVVHTLLINHGQLAPGSWRDSCPLSVGRKQAYSLEWLLRHSRWHHLHSRPQLHKGALVFFQTQLEVFILSIHSQMNQISLITLCSRPCAPNKIFKNTDIFHIQYFFWIFAVPPSCSVGSHPDGNQRGSRRVLAEPHSGLCFLGGPCEYQVQCGHKEERG